MNRTLANKIGWKRLLMALILSTTGAALLGCQGLMVSYRGAGLTEVNLIPVLEGATRSDHFETADLTVDYQYTRNGDSLQFSGDVRYGSALRHNFVTVTHFHLRVFFADAQGKVLQDHGIAVGGYGYTDDLMRFQERLTLPPGTAFMAFGYSGRAADGGHHDGRTETSFWFDPIAH